MMESLGNFIESSLGGGLALSVFFLSMRIAGILFLTPLLNASILPISIRTILVLSLSVALSLGIAPATHERMPILASFDLGGLLYSSITELALGITLALGILTSFASISVAGRMLDIQIGFGIAQVFDPLTRSQLPVLTAAFNQIAVIYFFLMNAHHVLLRAIAFSVVRFPLGAVWPLNAAALPVMKQVGGLFSLGLALGAPFVFCVLLVELSLGVIARNLPQMNMFVMGVPIKIVVGLIALSLGLALAGGTISRIQNSIFHSWDEIFSISLATCDHFTEKGFA